MTTPHDDGSTRISGRHATGEVPVTGTTTGADVTSRMAGTHGHDTTRAKTSAGATFALVFGLAALFCALTGILAPAAVLFGITGIVLGIAGMKMAKRPHVTGKGLAIGGLVTAILGLLLGGAVIAGAAVLVNDEARLDQLQRQIENLRPPSVDQVTNSVTG